LYEQAARQGHAPAQAALGILLFKEGNRNAALPWLKRAADAGEPRALLIYGTAMFNGDGVPSDRVQGYSLVKRSAGQGLADAAATQSEMELVMPESERTASAKLASAESAPAPPAATEPRKVAARKSVAAKSGPSARQAKLTIQTARPAGAKAAPAPPAPSTGDWRIQLGAFRQPGAGQALFARLAPRLPGKRPAFVPVGSLTRLQVGPFASLADATAACRAVGSGQACLPVRVP
jgi:TPR repeat protein